MKKNKNMVYYCFSIIGEHIQKKGWDKLYSLWINIIQYKNLFQLAFILDLASVQVYILRFHVSLNSQ